MNKKTEWKVFIWTCSFITVLLTWWVVYKWTNNELAIGIQRTIEQHQRNYVGDLSNRVFHHVDCPLITNMPERNKVSFSSRQAAVDMDFSPCTTCQP